MPARVVLAMSGGGISRGIPMENQRQGQLTRQIREEVKAQMKRYAMAKNREAFIDRLVEVLIPALRHHYRAALGLLNDRPDQVEKWQQQEDGFFDQFTDRIQEATKAKKLDRRKAVAQALKELMEHDEARVRLETSTFQKTYKVKSLKPLSGQVRDAFLARVWEIVNTIFPA